MIGTYFYQENFHFKLTKVIKILFKTNFKIVNKVENLSGKMGLIKYWNDMTEDTKNSIWKYVQVLYVTGMAAQGYKEELNQVIKEVNMNINILFFILLL